MENSTTVHVDNLPTAVLDLNATLVDIRDELENIQEVGTAVVATMAAMQEELRVLRKTLDRVEHALGALHHLSAISDALHLLCRSGR
jgi:hypothetical protein